ncbi:MAG: hypothetical protein ABWZ25_16350 [Chitinophagaceae bacterium]
MKKIRILPVVVLLVIAVAFSSCSSGRQYQSYPPPPPRTSVSLIINAGPGMPISRYRDGRYYYRSPQGYTYWRGYDNRYYLDRHYVHRSYHHHHQYNDWRRSGRRR